MSYSFPLELNIYFLYIYNVTKFTILGTALESEMPTLLFK